MRESTSNGNGWYNSEAEDDDQDQDDDEDEDEDEDGQANKESDGRLSRASSTQSAQKVTITASLCDVEFLRPNGMPT